MGRGDARWGSRSPKPAAPLWGQEWVRRGPPLCRGAPGPKEFSSVPRKAALQGGVRGFPASFGTEGVGGLRGAVWGARGWGARASRLAHGGRGGGPSLRSLPRGGVCGGGSGSVVHRGFYSQPLFWGCRGVGSSGSQFSTGPEDRGNDLLGRQARSFCLSWSESKALTRTHRAPHMTCPILFLSSPTPHPPHPVPSMATLASLLFLLGSRAYPRAFAW